MPGLDSNPRRLTLEPLLPATALPLNIRILPRREKTSVATTNRRPSSIHPLVFLWKLEKRNGSPSPTPIWTLLFNNFRRKKILLYIERFLLLTIKKKKNLNACIASKYFWHGHDCFTKSHQSVIPVCRVDFCSMGTPSLFILHLSMQTSLSLHHSFLS